MVTRPLTADEIAEQGFSSTQMCYDSRNLLHYFRLLPDRRMLFGLRGGTSASAEAFEQSRIRARQDFDRMFPAWETVETAHFWSGLLCLSRRLTPFAGPLGDLPNAWGALAFHGNGVAMGSYAGRLIADLALGRSAVADRPHPAFMQLPPRRFGLGRHRRAILPILYRWFGLLDL